MKANLNVKSQQNKAFGSLVNLFLYSENGWCNLLQQSLIFLKANTLKDKHTPTATAHLFQRHGREMYLDFVVDHTVACYPRNLFQSVALFCLTLVNKDSQQSPLSVLGRVRVAERYQPIPDGFQNVGLRGRNAEKNIDFLCGVW